MTLRSHGLQPTRLLSPWDFPSKNIGVSCHFLLHGIFPTQGSNMGLLHCRQIVYQLSYKGSPWKKSYDQPRQHIKKQDITLPTNVRLAKAMVFPVVMYGCESWTMEKAERWSINGFELLCWRRLLRVPWTARRFNQSILKETLNIYWKDRCWS